MNLKKWILVLLFLQASQISFNAAPVLAQEDKEKQEIKSTVDDIFMAFGRWDAGYVIGKVSANYHDVSADGSIIDYAKLKSLLEERMNKASKIYVDYKISDIDILSLVLNDQKNNAVVEAEFKWQGLDLNSVKEVNGKHKRKIVLQKEGDSWKIIQYVEQDS